MNKEIDINMKTLYIIGNGFDVAHGLNTNYWGLRTYIEKKDPVFLSFFESQYGIQSLDDTEPWYTKKAQERWNESVDHSLWSEFEYHMGNPNTWEMIEMSECVTEGMPKNGIRYHMDCYWREQFGGIKKLHSYVKEWIGAINTEKLKPLRTSLINSTDIFMSFNYTDVLEKVYGINDVMHIHGGISSICSIDPIMGHCNKDDIKKHRMWAKEADDEYAEAKASVQDAVADYLEAIYKDTDEQIKLNSDFFKKLNVVKHIVIIGWAGGKVDLPYLYKIIENVNQDTYWTVYWYDTKAYDTLKHVFKNCGISNINLVEFKQADTFWNN